MKLFWICISLLIPHVAFADQQYQLKGQCNKQLTLELAETPKQITTGLSNRKALAPDHGMLFVFYKPQILSFWMKNTYIPLDIIFLDQDMIVKEIHPNNQPLDLTPVRSRFKLQYALEVNAGFAKQCSLKIGDQLHITKAL